MLSGGPFDKKKSLYLLREKINIGGMVLPDVETATIIVTFVPRSAEVIEPTLCLPFAATILLDFDTVETAVSSIFHIFEATCIYPKDNPIY